MLHQIVEIYEENRYLSLERGFLNIRTRDDKIASVPLDDIAVLLVSAQAAHFSKHILTELAARGAISVLCGDNYVPQALIVPVESHYRQTAVLKLQIQAPLPLQKNLWKAVVTRKLLNQALVLRTVGQQTIADKLRSLAGQVRSGDSDNKEGQGARLYWPALFGSDFIRDRALPGINALLNYGYAVMRAAMTRAVITAGLQPSLGIHHRNQLDPFCLADDLFEPYRPLVDLVVYNSISRYQAELIPAVKQLLIQALWIKMATTEGCSPAFQSMHYLASSFVAALHQGKQSFKIPVWEGNVEDFSGAEQV